jgi:hypothetical protein
MILIFFILAITYIFYLGLPHLYTWIGWNYAIVGLTLFFLFMNFAVSTFFMSVYWLIPKNIIDACFRSITKWFRSSHSEMIDRLESNLRETFKIKIHYPIPEKSIRIWHPHGISAVAVGIHNGFRITDDRLTPSKGILHSAVGYIPLLEDLMRQIHCIPSHYGVIKNTLKTESITIGLGGTDEMGRIKHKQLELVIRKRRGIFKIALETGTPIVPVLTYGENEIFPESENDLLRRYNDFLYTNFRIRVPFPSFKSFRTT